MSKASDYQPLDPLAVALSGASLVEANAGTGKTYNIVSLYLRLLLEAKMSVDQILVVSFTEAATAELRDRVRKRLRTLQVVFEAGEGDPADLGFLNICADRKTALLRITRALQSFDQAAIYTIHGFCQRLLTEAAFESGLPQTTELITSDDAIRRELISDFWHAETASGTPGWINYLLKNANPEKLYAQFASYFARPLIRRLSVEDPGDSTTVENDFENHCCRIKMNWDICRSDIVRILSQDKGLNRGTYRSDTLEKLWESADLWFAADTADIDLPKKFFLMGSKTIGEKTKKGFIAPEHEFFDQAQQVWDSAQQLDAHYSARISAVRLRLLQYADEELPRRKQIMRVRHFDDLLADVHKVLQSSQASALQQAVSRQYRAALIDEFQDTDPLQFAIFEQLFCEAGAPVFFVGDPKQAIYGFRGADVHAYLEARATAAQKYRLDSNYRSTQKLVESVNAIFQKSPKPFLIDGIEFQPSSAAHDMPGLNIDGIEQPAMRWWHLDSDSKKALTGADAEKQIAESIASEIRQLLEQTLQNRVYKPDSKPLEAKDIAVLVSSHDQGGMVRDALEDRGVACAQRTEDNVFQTTESHELWCVLRAVVEPARSALVRAALATDLLGYDASQIDAIEQDDQEWQALLDRFAAYPETWRQHGFSRMFRGLLRDFDVQQRLLARIHGQRLLGNVMQLADLLQQESAQRHGRFDDVLVWMREQQKIKRPTDQAMLLRLESDDNLVTIMTVHLSKGLQFPVVFCPYLWRCFEARDPGPVEFHDQDNRAVLDLAIDKENKHKAQQDFEKLAERVRVTYVALTRAELSCTSVWGFIKDTKNAGLNWLLADDTASADDARRLMGPGKGQTRPQLESLQSEAMTVEDMPAPTTEKFRGSDAPRTKFKARVMQRDIPGGWRVSSFSALTRHAVEEPRDYDAGKSADRPELAEPTGIFAFPRGARAGRCMHALLENIAFDAQCSDIEAMTNKVLADYGFSASQRNVLADMAINVLSTQLNREGSIRLCDVAPHQRVVEMEFYFPTTRLNAGALRSALGDFGAGSSIEKRLGQLDFHISDGFMHGYIDLIFAANGRFFLADYKSNWLGNDQEDYRVDQLSKEIARHDYYLQYLIYSAALDRHLAQVVSNYDYDTHFGGAYYLFLRGMHPDSGPEYGVFFDRPDRALMQRLQALFGERVTVN